MPNVPSKYRIPLLADDISHDFPKVLKEIRKQAGKTQVDVADALGVTSGMVSQWERGHSGASLPKVAGFAEECGYQLAFVRMRQNPLTHIVEARLPDLRAEDVDMLVDLIRLLAEKNVNHDLDKSYLEYQLELSEAEL